MRKVTLMMLLTFLTVNLFAEILVVPISNLTVENKNVTTINKPTIIEYISTLTPQDFLSITPKKIKAVTGNNLSLTQRIALKLAQKNVRKQLKAGQDVDMMKAGSDTKSGVDALWLLLGALLGLIGVIIALVTKKDKDDNRVKSALIGWLIWIVLLLLII